MSLRTTAIDLMFNADINKIMRTNEAVDGIRDGAVEAVSKTDQLSDSLDNASGSVRSLGDWLGDNWLQIGAAGAAAGGAIIGLTNKAEGLNSGLRRVEIATGETTESLDEMIRGMVDATWDVGNTVEAMEELVKMGVTSRQEFEQILPVLDDYADATGKDMVQAAQEFETVLSALDVELTEAGDHMDAFTWLSTQTTVSMGDLGRTMRREQGAIRDMGLSVDDISIAMAALESEGIKGPRAVMAFQESIQNAEGDIDAFWDGLGVTNDALSTQAERLEGAAGLTESLAESNNQSLTIWDRMKHRVEMATWAMGSYLEPVRDLGPLLMGLGPLTKGLSGGLTLLSKVKLSSLIPAMKATIASTWAFTAALLANPITWVIAGIVALGAALYALWKNWDEVSAWFSDRWDWVKDQVAGVMEWFQGIPGMMMDIGRDMMSGLAEGITGRIKAVTDTAKNAAKSVADGFKSFFGISSPSRLMMEYGTNIQEGLQQGMDQEQAQIPVPAAGVTNNSNSARMNFSPRVEINVNSGGQEAADELEARLRKIFPDLAEEIFANLSIKAGVN